ncbi:MAG: hypothetical protein KAS86_03775 [Candidatus Omnitrophica bacterium]|nr:hypothetical protein [Candidatus Omnitrophota bacterium]
MGKVLSLLIGAVATVIGLILLVVWWYELLIVLRGVVPAILILGGVIAVVAGMSELKDVLKSKEKKEEK